MFSFDHIQHTSSTLHVRLNIIYQLSLKCFMLWSEILWSCEAIFHQLGPLGISLLYNPKGFRSDFSSKLQPPKMPGKLPPDQFWVDKLGNFIVTYLITFSRLAPSNFINFWGMIESIIVFLKLNPRITLIIVRDGKLKQILFNTRPKTCFTINLHYRKLELQTVSNLTPFFDFISFFQAKNID